MAIKPEYPPQRPCRCGGTNPNCPRCGGTGFIGTPGFRPIMAGPAGVKRRYVPRESMGTIQGPPAPKRCPHCGFEVLNLAAHLTEAHPDKPQGETAEEREAREQEEARQAAVAAEIVRSEAEAARRKAEARARRQAIEGPDFAGPLPGQAGAHPQASPSQQPDEQVRPADAAVQVDLPAPAGEADAGSPPHGRSHAPGDSSERGTGAEERPAGSEGEAWERLRRAYAERTILTGVVCDRKPFGVFVNLGGIEGLVRNSEMCAADAAGEASGLQRGRTVTVVVIGMREEGRRVELSMRRVGESRTPPKERGATAAAARPAEGTMALAFRLAREKKENAG